MGRHVVDYPICASYRILEEGEGISVKFFNARGEPYVTLSPKQVERLATEVFVPPEERRVIRAALGALNAG